MAGIYNGPSRGGTRGGKDQFSWDSVKSDQQREFYLGHSVKAATGRWLNGKDIFWYQKEKKDSLSLTNNEEAIAQERAMAKQREEALMMEALGLKPNNPQLQQQPATGTNAIHISRREGDGHDDLAKKKEKEEKKRRKEKRRQKKKEKKERKSDKHSSKRKRRDRSRSRSSSRSSSISGSSGDEDRRRRRRRWW